MAPRKNRDKFFRKRKRRRKARDILAEVDLDMHREAMRLERKRSREELFYRI